VEKEINRFSGEFSENYKQKSLQHLWKAPHFNCHSLKQGWAKLAHQMKFAPALQLLLFEIMT
jgi:hypothetical protein